MNSIIEYIRDCIQNVRLFFYKSFYCQSMSDTESVNSFQETLIELKSKDEVANYISLNEMLEENCLDEELINLPEVQHYYDYNIPTNEL